MKPHDLVNVNVGGAGNRATAGWNGGAAEDAATATPLEAEPQTSASTDSRLPIEESSPVAAEEAQLTRSVVNLVAPAVAEEASTVQKASTAAGSGSAAEAAPKPLEGPLVQETVQQTSLIPDDRVSVAWATLVAQAEAVTTAAAVAKETRTLARPLGEVGVRVMWPQTRKTLSIRWEPTLAMERSQSPRSRQRRRPQPQPLQLPNRQMP